MSFVVFFVQRTGEEAKLAGSKAGVVFNQVSCILILKLSAYTTGFLLKKQTNYRMGSAAFHETQFCLEKLAVNKEKPFYHDHFFFFNYA